MTFDEIFKEKGLYKTEGFMKGYCLEVDADGWLHGLTYKHKDDLLPQREAAFIHKSMLGKKFEKVYTRQSLFN